jgi:hypothetical protein
MTSVTVVAEISTQLKMSTYDEDYRSGSQIKTKSLRCG